MIPFNFHHLYYFYTIAKTGSVSKAAKQLRLAQPTLSAQLKQFESFLDKKLFDRERRMLVLTEDGHEVLRYASLIFDLGKEFMDRQGDLSQKGRIRIQIGVGSFVPKTILTMLIEFILKLNPNAYVVVTEKSIPRLLGELKDHLLDAVLCDRLPMKDHEEALEYKLVAKVPIYFCGHPKFKRLARQFPASLKNAPLILPTNSSVAAESIKAYLTEHQLEPKVIAEIQDLEVVRRMVLDGFGIAPLNLLAIRKAPAAGTNLIVFGQSANHPLEEKTYLLYKKRKTPHPLVEKIAQGFRV